MQHFSLTVFKIFSLAISSLIVMCLCVTLSVLTLHWFHWAPWICKLMVSLIGKLLDFISKKKFPALVHLKSTFGLPNTCMLYSLVGSQKFLSICYFFLIIFSPQYLDWIISFDSSLNSLNISLSSVFYY